MPAGRRCVPVPRDRMAVMTVMAVPAQTGKRHGTQPHGTDGCGDEVGTHMGHNTGNDRGALDGAEPSEY